MTLAPVVTDLSRQYVPAQPLNIFDLATQMSAHIGGRDKKFAALVARAWDIRDTIDQTLADLEHGGTPSLLDRDPAQLADLIRQAAHDRAARILDNVGYSGARRAHDALTAQLDEELRAALPPFADKVVEAVRPTFDDHAAVIVAAFDAGITQDTNPADLATKGTPEQIEAFRTLPRAVAGLEQIKTLRDSLTMTLNYGPRDLLGLAYIGPVERTADLQTAANRYAPEIEKAQYHQTDFPGATFVDIERDRVGGRWLHMVTAGLTLRLNTAAEVEDLRTTAQAA